MDKEDAAKRYRDAAEHHAKVYADFGWPSPELDAANRECSAAATAYRRALSIGPLSPIPVR